MSGEGHGPMVSFNNVPGLSLGETRKVGCAKDRLEDANESCGSRRTEAICKA